MEMRVRPDENKKQENLFDVTWISTDRSYMMSIPICSRGSLIGPFFHIPYSLPIRQGKS